eukprot:scaffold4492_cov371-Prasinococcus_capsulatus_cf.AAC.3
MRRTGRGRGSGLRPSSSTSSRLPLRRTMLLGEAAELEEVVVYGGGGLSGEGLAACQLAQAACRRVAGAVFRSSPHRLGTSVRKAWGWPSLQSVARLRRPQPALAERAGYPLPDRGGAHSF